MKQANIWKRSLALCLSLAMILPMMAPWTVRAEGTDGGTGDSNPGDSGDTTPVTYTVTLNANGGTYSGTTSFTTGDDGTMSSDKIFPTDEPTRENYTFKGWFTAETGGTEVTAWANTYTSDTTYYAQWTADPVTTDKITITFDANGGSETPTAVEIDEDGKLTATQLAYNGTKEGYTFDGWYLENTFSTKVTTSTTFDSTSTIYAQWTENTTTTTTYTITFDANGGTGTTDSDTTGTDGKLSTIPTAPTAPDGKTFKEWNTANDGTGTKLTTSIVHNADTEYFAIWEDEATEATAYTISLNPNGGATDDWTVNTGTDKTLSTLPTATRSGYTFDGWFTSSTGGTQITTSTVFTSNTTIYAQWTESELNDLKITFDHNFPSTSTNAEPTDHSSLTNEYGKLDEIYEPTGDECPDDYTFVEWNSEDDGTGTTLTTSTVHDEATTYYAIWKLGTLTVAKYANPTLTYNIDDKLDITDLILKITDKPYHDGDLSIAYT